MSKALAAAISALALVQFAGPAVAAPTDAADRRIEQLLRQVLTKAAPAEALTLVTRAASIKVVGTIKRVGGFNLPIACIVFVSDGEGHNEEKSSNVSFIGNTGTCTVNIPFRWANTDQDGKVNVSVNVANGPLEFLGSSQVTASNPISRSSVLNLPEIDLPLPGSTATLSFDIRM